MQNLSTMAFSTI